MTEDLENMLEDAEEETAQRGLYDTHTNSLSLSHTHTLSLSLTHTLFLSLTHTLSYVGECGGDDGGSGEHARGRRGGDGPARAVRFAWRGRGRRRYWIGLHWHLKSIGLDYTSN